MTIKDIKEKLDRLDDLKKQIDTLNKHIACEDSFKEHSFIFSSVIAGTIYLDRTLGIEIAKCIKDGLSKKYSDIIKELQEAGLKVVDECLKEELEEKIRELNQTYNDCHASGDSYGREYIGKQIDKVREKLKKVNQCLSIDK